AVQDKEIGMKQEDMPRLFESFVRLDSDLKIGTPGTGLGLYLTRKIATEQLKGSVSVESTYGEGSTFILRIPKGI
ncbi:MAG TPA: ATP-binding protein, partial [Syntrophales bacterium]|nr:ATP-binding protein [Syntrophales bacterium]